MSSLEHARVASLVSSIDDHLVEIGQLVDRLSDAEADAEVAVSALYEAERSLQMARRSLDRAASDLRGR